MARTWNNIHDFLLIPLTWSHWTVRGWKIYPVSQGGKLCFSEHMALPLVIFSTLSLKIRWAILFLVMANRYRKHKWEKNSIYKIFNKDPVLRCHWIHSLDIYEVITIHHSVFYSLQFRKKDECIDKIMLWENSNILKW